MSLCMPEVKDEGETSVLQNQKIKSSFLSWMHTVDEEYHVAKCDDFLQKIPVEFPNSQWELQFIVNLCFC